MNKLEGFSDNTRIWIYQTNRLLSNSEISSIGSILNEFSKEWATHGSRMKTACFIEGPCFAIMAVDQNEMEASGCSIDSSVRILKQIEQEFDLDFFDRLNLSFENNEGQIEIIKMNDFQNGLKSGIFNEETVVFNNLINSIEEYRTVWRTPVKNSWHKNLF
jgi:hypothetical protein